MNNTVLRRAPLVVLLYHVSVIVAQAGVSIPLRIVSIGGSNTEIVYELGAAERLVAVDSLSRYPAEVAGKQNIGYMRALSAEPILALRPSLILADPDAGPPTALAQMREAGVTVLLVPGDPSPVGITKKVRAIASALNVPARGEALVARIEAQLSAARGTVARVTRRPRVLFLLPIGGGSPLAGGDGTAAQAIIELAGGVNAASDFKGFKPISAEAIIATAPDYLLMTQRSVERMGGASAVFDFPGINITPAGRSRRLIVMDGLLLLGFGPRTPNAIIELARNLHPGLDW